jgi:Ca2+-binding EF-hand superfamily protein
MEELHRLLQTDPNTKSINLELMEIESLEPLMDLLPRFSQLQELQLFGNRLTELPRDLSALQTLEILDVSNNLLSEAEDVLEGLTSLSALCDLQITLRSEAEEEKLGRSLPNLRTLNEVPVPQVAAPSSPLSKLLPPPRNEVRFEEHELEAIALTYDGIRSLWREKAPEVDKVLAYYFDVNVKQVMNELTSALGKTPNPHLKNVQIIKAKYDLNSVCLYKLTAYNQTVDKKASGFEVEIVDKQKKLFNELFEMVFKLNEELGKLVPPEHCDLIDTHERLQEEVARLKQDKEQMRMEFAAEKRELVEEIGVLQDENQKYLDTIIKHSKKNADNALKNTVEDRENSRPTAKSTPTPSLVQASGKLLTMKQLKEVIEEIYQSKGKYDEKCVDTHMPQETMEQHMYTFLNQKYGLKALIVDWATAIINSVKAYALEDNDVAVFGKILRNECDEEFRHVQQQLKKTVAELVQVSDRQLRLRKKFPMKTKSDLSDMFTEKCNGALTEEEWTEIVSYMYSPDDADQLKAQLLQLAYAKPYADKRQKTKQIHFRDFLQSVLDFQLKGHELFLQKFVKLFRRVDLDHNGIISPGEFFELASSMEMGYSEAEIGSLLNIADPYSHQQLTFSGCIVLFNSVSSRQETDESGETVLYKLSLAQT